MLYNSKYIYWKIKKLEQTLTVEFCNEVDLYSAMILSANLRKSACVSSPGLLSLLCLSEKEAITKSTSDNSFKSVFDWSFLFVS